MKEDCEKSPRMDIRVHKTIEDLTKKNKDDNDELVKVKDQLRLKTKALNKSDQGKKDLAKSVGVLQDDLEKEKNKANHLEVELVRLRKRNENLEEIGLRKDEDVRVSPRMDEWLLSRGKLSIQT